MDTDKLYKVDISDTDKIKTLLSRCFMDDELYRALIPNHQTRLKLIPELMSCDVEEFYNNCEIYADSEDIHGVIIVSDESVPYNPVTFYLRQWYDQIRTDSYLIKEDPSLELLKNFSVGKDYLNESWTDQLHNNRRIHIIYFAVDPIWQHHGIADTLMDAVIDYAEEKKLMISLETHNPDNIQMYEHYGFKLYGVLHKHLSDGDLKQYCLIREI